jgi:hypothetical protein
VIRTSALVDWTSDQLAEAGETVKVVRSRGVETGFPSQPDRLVIVARTGGPGLALDAVFDVPSFQIRTRGAQNDPDDAETLADLVDRLYLDAAMPMTLDGRHVVYIRRVGSPRLKTGATKPAAPTSPATT